MTPKRLSIKFFVKPGSNYALSKFIGLFHKFIQNKSVEGLLVDVADYEHVPDGPGILLIGHNVDYGMDLTGGKPGLLVRRKRCEGDLSDLLRDTLRKALTAITAIEKDGSTGAAYSTDVVEVALIDKLAAPNTDEAFARVLPDVEAVLSELYGNTVKAERGDRDPRQNLTFIVRVAKHESAETLRGRLAAEPANA